ncbi:MAG: alginate lyase family protein [Victivallales bacterium]|nr:alginate lyase family protein [Victivallales bacterium]
MARASLWLTRPVPVLKDAIAEHSMGGPNDFYSEGDYWWPNPVEPDGPYIRRDGYSNPNCFTQHRRFLQDMALCVAHMAVGFCQTGASCFAQKAENVLRRWFVDSDTAMTPNLKHAQAIKGVCEGRGIGIIDTVHLAECALAVRCLASSNALSNEIFDGVKCWFTAYIHWLKNSQNGREERCHPNNHGACWFLQAAAFARLCKDKQTLQESAQAFESFLLPMMDNRGGFPAELARTKPYGYSIFQLDVLCALAVILSWDGTNWFRKEDKKGHSLALAMSFLYPYLENKTSWRFPKDVMYWDKLPNRPSSLIFCGHFLDCDDYIALWHHLPWSIRTHEILRNTPVRIPQLWIQS